MNVPGDKSNKPSKIPVWVQANEKENTSFKAEVKGYII